ncbi:MAG: glycosyltransferase [bacterium]
MKKLSIVIATYNRRKYLKNCLHSILQGNIEVDYEIVVVDGGSTDGTQEFLMKQPYTRIIEDKREGPTKAYNQGIRAAEGEYVCWLNDDLMLVNDSLMNLLNFLEREKGNRVEIIGAFYFSEVEENNFDIRSTFGLPDASFGMAKTSVMKKLKYFDETFVRFHSDSDINLRAWERGLVTVGVREAKLKHYLVDDHIRKDFALQGYDDYRVFLKRWNYHRVKRLIFSIKEKLIDKYLEKNSYWQYFLVKALFLQEEGELGKSDYLIKKIYLLLDEVTELNSGWAYEWGLGVAKDIFYESKKFNTAERWFKFIISLKDNCSKNIRVTSLIHLGNLYSQQGKFSEAEEKLREAISLEPKDKSRVVSIYYAMGSNYEKQGKLDKAKEKFNEVIELSKEFASYNSNKYIGGAHFHLGCIYKGLNRTEETRHHLEECLRFTPQHRKARESLMFYSLEPKHLSSYLSTLPSPLRMTDK